VVTTSGRGRAAGMLAAVANCMKNVIGLTYALFVTACGVSDSAAAVPDPDTARSDQGATDSVALSGPDINATGQSKMSAIASSGGPGMRIDGGTDLASYAEGLYWVTTRATSVTAEFTVAPAAGASFMYELLGSGSSYSTRHLRLQRTPDSDALQAVAASGIVTCGPLASGVPTNVTLSFDGAAGTFDVLIGGAPSACSDLPTRLLGPPIAIRFVDAGNAGYGGHVEFTNLALF
jgi:hypothetical protein